jgi:hypothetical protein
MKRLLLTDEGTDLVGVRTRILDPLSGKCSVTCLIYLATYCSSTIELNVDLAMQVTASA